MVTKLRILQDRTSFWVPIGRYAKPPTDEVALVTSLLYCRKETFSSPCQLWMYFIIENKIWTKFSPTKCTVHACMCHLKDTHCIMISSVWCTDRAMHYPSLNYVFVCSHLTKNCSLRDVVYIFYVPKDCIFKEWNITLLPNLFIKYCTLIIICLLQILMLTGYIMSWNR